MGDPLKVINKSKPVHCRMCAKQKNYAELLDLSADVKTFEEYIDIVDFLQVDFIDLGNDRLPKTTCEKCYDVFQDCFKFFTKLKESQQILKDKYKGNVNINVKLEPSEGHMRPFKHRAEREAGDKTGDEPKSSGENIESESTVVEKDSTDNEEQVTEGTSGTKDVHKDPIYTENPEETIEENLTEKDNLNESITYDVDNSLTDKNSIYTETSVAADTNSEETVHKDSTEGSNNLEGPNNQEGPTNQEGTSQQTNIPTEETTVQTSETIPGPSELIKSFESNPGPSNTSDIPVDPLSITHCRFCASPNKKSDLINLNEDKDKLEECHNMLHFFKKVVNLTTQKLPNSTCQACYKTLQKSYNYFKTVKRNQELLNNIYNIKLENLLKIKLEPLHEDLDDDTPLALCNVTVLNDDTWATYPWICKFCQVVFKKLEDLRSHAKEKHSMCHALICVDCKATFETYADFVQHVRNHRPMLRQFCPFCDDSFPAAEQCEQHVNTHYSSTQKICSFCGEIFPYQNSLEYHQHLYGKKVVHTDGAVRSWVNYEWCCDECGTRFDDVTTLRFHVQGAHGKCFSMRCADCTKSVANFKLFAAHVVSHRPYLKKFCQYCNLHFENGASLSQHILQHITSQQRPCNLCGQVFQDNLQLARHKRDFSEKPNRRNPRRAVKDEKAKSLLENILLSGAEDNDSPPPPKRKRKPRAKVALSIEDLTCKICSKFCETTTKLKRHVPTHDIHRPRNFACVLCGAAFLSAGSLRDHVKKHSGRTEECQMCHRKFYTRHQLKAHIVTHSEEKPFVCDECGSSFKTKNRLKCHLFKHTDEKPFRCAYCFKEFKFKENLKTHEYQHTGQRPYSCEYCERTFTNWANCNKHMIRKHGVTLARTKITEHGRMVIDRKTGEASTIARDPHAIEWFKETLKPDRPGKKVKQ